MTKEISKNNVKETVVEAVEDVKETVVEAVEDVKEKEVNVDVINVKKSAWDKTADVIAKYRKPVLRFLTGAVIGAVAFTIYKSTKQDEEDVIEGDFDTFDDE